MIFINFLVSSFVIASSFFLLLLHWVSLLIANLISTPLYALIHCTAKKSHKHDYNNTDEGKKMLGLLLFSMKQLVETWGRFCAFPYTSRGQ